MIVKKPQTELTVCAEALRKLTMDSSVETLKACIAEGYLHLHELRATVHCNPLLLRSLSLRIDRAEALLDQKQSQVAAEVAAAEKAQASKRRA